MSLSTVLEPPRPEVLLFLREIKEHPEDDTPRLILADWLQDRGEARGEFVHLQVVRARLDRGDPQALALERREKALLGRHLFAWLDCLVDHVVAWQFARGLVRLEARAEKFLSDAVEALAGTELCAWVDVLRLRDLQARHLSRLAESAHLGGLTGLDLSETGLKGPDLVKLLRSPRLAGLSSLHLAGNRLGPDAAAALANCPYLGRLRTLDLTDNRIGAGTLALAESPHLTSLSTLHLAGNRVDLDGLTALRQRFGDGARVTRP
jgi:uncharacterized protein (TIGR02996 family)